MPNTRKKVIKTVYKDEDSEGESGDFSDSGSDAHISEQSVSEDEEIEKHISEDDFDTKPPKSRKKQPVKRKPKFAKEFVGKITKQVSHINDESEVAPALISVKDLTDEDKLLPSILNLSESDSSDDESPRPPIKKPVPSTIFENDAESENEGNSEYTDIWSKNMHDNSAEIAKKTFMELAQHKSTIEETKTSLQSYVSKSTNQGYESNVKDLLALGEEVSPQKSPAKKKTKVKKKTNDSDSEVEDWEEVKESKSIPQQGLQLVVELSDLVSRKSKKIDVEMMMKRKINRVKKEHQVFMHKVHVLSWIAHGNYVNRVLNEQEIMAAALSMVPKGCYPEDRLNMKYVEQITTWFKEKCTLKYDKYENKYKPKAPPLKSILLDQIKKRVFTSHKYFVYIFVAMLRALGLQCRVILNFVTVPLKPPSSELCSLSTKPKQVENKVNEIIKNSNTSKGKAKRTATKSKKTCSENIPQLDGNYDYSMSSDSEFQNIMQVDGNDDKLLKTKSLRSTRAKKLESTNANVIGDDVSPPKRSKTETIPSEEKIIKAKQVKLENSKSPNRKINSKKIKENDEKVSLKSPEANNFDVVKSSSRSLSLNRNKLDNNNITSGIENDEIKSPRRTRSSKNNTPSTSEINPPNTSMKLSVVKDKNLINPPNIVVTDENSAPVASIYFNPESNKDTKVRSTRKRSHTMNTQEKQKLDEKKNIKPKTRAKSAPGNSVEKSRYFDEAKCANKKPKLSAMQLKKQEQLEDPERVSHRDLVKSKSNIAKSKVKPKNDITNELIGIIKGRIKSEKEKAKIEPVKGKTGEQSSGDSDYLPVENSKYRNSDSEDDFKPIKISPKPSRPSTIKKIDRRVLSSDDDVGKTNNTDVWCEVYVEELEQWISVDITTGKVHCTSHLYSHATHPVCYLIGWDNNNYLKDVTRRYDRHWNTVTRKQRAEPNWWKVAVAPWLGPKNARDREEDEALDRMHLEAPLPKSIAEYKNHPLYALKRHLLKFEAIYPPDAATLGFVRNEPVYARECVYTCRSRDTWLKEAKVVKLGEIPYKVVKARPKWDKLSNKLITDKPLEVFGPWQVQDYEPPVAENGMVPRNAYGNVELFKDCMLPKGTVHIKLPGLNKVARKLNIDCAPAMTGFDFNGGWSHPVYDGFVVCKEFEEIVTEAWVKDQEEQVRREQEKLELRVYGNWKRLIKGLLIRERLKLKYGFEEPITSQAGKSKSKGPRLVTKKKL